MDLVENDVLIRLFGEIERALEKLRWLAQTPKRAFLKSFEKTDSAKYNFIVVIEAAIDLCSHLIAEKGWGTPEDYGDVFRIAGNAGLFDETFVEQLVEMAKFRNLIVHLYWKVDNERVYEILREDLHLLDDFRTGLRLYLQQNQS